MTPTEMKAEALDKLRKKFVSHKGERFDILFAKTVKELDRKEKAFWKRMSKLDEDTMSGKNRAFQMTRTMFTMGESFEDSKTRTEVWNPDTKEWR